MTNHKVIYDTDPGVDDAIALMQALHPEIELLGVTSMFGNATIETTTANAPYLRSRFAPGVPVARGAAAPLHRVPPAPVGWIHGDNGLGNIELSEPADTMLDARLAHLHDRYGSRTSRGDADRSRSVDESGARA